MMSDTNRSMDRYQIRKQIGVGGMGTVYQAWDREIEREVALKWLPESFSAEKNFVERFRREARFIARLEHPHIVPIYDVGEYQGRPFIIMRLLSGGTLRDRMSRPDFGLTELMGAMTQIADALMSAHSQHIVHRDIKPGNILFDDRGVAFLSDFGVAKLLDAATMLTGSGVVGTPAYMSPEQFIGHDIDGRSDQYSLAVVIYEALSGQLPFDGNTVQMMYKHLNTEPPEIDLANLPSLADLNSVLKKALAKNPNDRYPTVQAFVAEARKITDRIERTKQFALPVAAPIPQPQSAIVTPSGLSIPASRTPSPRSSAATVVDTSTPAGETPAVPPPGFASQQARPSVWSTPSSHAAEPPAADTSPSRTPASQPPASQTPASQPSSRPSPPSSGVPVSGGGAASAAESKAPVQPETGQHKEQQGQPPSRASMDYTVVETATPLPARPSQGTAARPPAGGTPPPATRQPSTRPPAVSSMPTVLDEAAVIPPSASLPPTQQVTPAAAPAATGGLPGWVRAAAGVVVLLLVVAVGWWLFSGLGGGNGGGEEATPEEEANPAVVVGDEATATATQAAEPTEAAAPTEAPSPTATPTTEPTATEAPVVLVQVVSDEADLREGPGEVYPAIGRVERGDQLEVVAKTADGNWYNIRLPNSPTLRAWIASSAVTPLNKDAIAGVEVAATIPAPPAGAEEPTAEPTTAPTVSVATTAPTIAPTQVIPTDPPPTNPPAPTDPPPPPPTDPPPPPPTDPPPPPPTYTEEPPPPPPPATYTPETP